MSATISAARRRHVLLASSLLVPLLSLGMSGAHAQQTASSEQLPPIEVSAPTDQNRTRAKPTYDERFTAYSCGGSRGIGEFPRTAFPFDPRTGNRQKLW